MGQQRGTYNQGSENPNAKLDEDEVAQIKKELKSGVRGVDLASQHDIDPSVIGKIKANTIWQHVRG